MDDIIFILKGGVLVANGVMSIAYFKASEHAENEAQRFRFRTTGMLYLIVALVVSGL